MELSPTRAIVPGSFDPITVGHTDVIERASKMFDHVTVAVSKNAEKTSMFTADERVAFAEAAVSHLKNVTVVIADGLLSDTMSELGAGTIVKGARGTTDFDYEYSLFGVMRTFAPGCDTVILPAKAEYAHVSSTYARELIRYGCSLDRALPAPVIPLVEKARSKK